MSDEDKPLEFSAKDLMPDWAQESSSKSTERKRPPRQDGGADRKDGGGKRRQDGPRDHGSRDSRGGGQGRSDRGGSGQRDRGGRDDRRGGPRGRNDRRDDSRGGKPPEERPLNGVTCVLEPSKAAVAGLTKLIKESLRAYPLADLAKMVLHGRDRYQARFSSEEGGPDLYFCKVDGSLWASHEEAVAHLLDGKGLEAFYSVEVVEVGSPSGNFSVVAVCGLSGVILGPPNHHEYQSNVAKLHAERFSHMPLDRYKSRVAMDNTEETIEKWKEQVSQVKHYRLKSDEEPEPAAELEEESPEESVSTEEAPDTSGSADDAPESADEPSDGDESAEVASAGEEQTDAAEESPETVSDEQSEESGEAAAEVAEDSATDVDADLETNAEVDVESVESVPEKDEVILKSVEELTRHFKENFCDGAIRKTRDAVVAGDVPARNVSRGLLVHMKQESEKLRRGFPLPMIQALCRAFEKKQMRFFKRGKKALHVSAVRPKAISNSISMTDQIQGIIDFLKENPRPKVIDLIDALADDFSKPEKGSKKGEPAKEVELTPNAKVVLSDLRWLVAEGYVIEFSDTSLVIGKMPSTGNDGAPSKKATAKKKAAKKKTAPKKKAVAEENTAVTAEVETPETVPEPIAEQEPEAVPEPTAEQEPETVSEPIAEQEPEAVPEPIAEQEPEAEAVPEPIAEQESEAVPEPSEDSEDVKSD